MNETKIILTRNVNPTCMDIRLLYAAETISLNYSKRSSDKLHYSARSPWLQLLTGCYLSQWLYLELPNTTPPLEGLDLDIVDLWTLWRQGSRNESPTWSGISRNSSFRLPMPPPQMWRQRAAEQWVNDGNFDSLSLWDIHAEWYK